MPTIKSIKDKAAAQGITVVETKGEITFTKGDAKVMAFKGINNNQWYLMGGRYLAKGRKGDVALAALVRIQAM